MLMRARTGGKCYASILNSCRETSFSVLTELLALHLGKHWGVLCGRNQTEGLNHCKELKSAIQNVHNYIFSTTLYHPVLKCALSRPFSLSCQPLLFRTKHYEFILDENWS